MRARAFWMRRARRSGGRTGRLLCEALEERALLATITVTGTGDTIANDGVVTLREAITAANTNAPVGDAPAGSSGMDTIVFKIPGTGVQTITLGTTFDINEPLTINGYSQPGASPNTLASFNNAVMKIELNAVGGVGGVFNINSGGAGSVIRGLVIHGGQTQITLNSGGNKIEGNFLGTNASGMAAAARTAVTKGAILITQGDGNQIGGNAPSQRNVIVGNGPGIQIGLGSTSSPVVKNTLIQGNYIGTNAIGTATLNRTGGPGILIAQAADTTIGGTATGAGNLISGNGQGGTGYGILMTGPTASSNQNGDVTIQGNLIGTDSVGQSAIGNQDAGIAWFGGLGTLSPVTLTIGGTDPGAGNVISGNGGDLSIQGGIFIPFGPNSKNKAVIQGNRIGTTADGTDAIPNRGFGIALGTPASVASTVGGTTSGAGNVIAHNTGYGVVVSGDLKQSNIVTILGNSIFGNGGLGIANGGLGFDPLTRPSRPNDPGDGDTGPNGFQNYPVLTSAMTSGGTTAITGRLDSAPNTKYTIEYFAGPAGPAGHTQGTFIGRRVGVTTDASGRADVAFDAPAVPAGQVVTATATDPDGRTSEFFPTGILAFGKPIPPTADLMVSQTPSASTVPVGSDLTYTITVRNIGPSAASGVILTETLPANVTFVSATGGMRPSAGRLTFVLSNLGKDESRVFTVLVRPDAAAAGTTLTSTAEVSGAETDPSNSNNQSPVSVAVMNVSPPAARGQLTFSSDTYRVGEDQGSVTITIVRNGGSAGTVSADFSTTGGSATPGSDYKPVSQSIVFGDGETSKTVTIPILDDTIVEGDESVGLLLSYIDGASGTTHQASATLTIVDNDRATPPTPPTSPSPPTPPTPPLVPTTPPPTTTPTTDVIGPAIVRLQRLGTRWQPTRFALTFSEDLNPASASDPNQYALSWLRRDGRLGRPLRLASATYDPMSRTVILTPLQRRLPLRLRYQLIARSSGLADLAGNPLDGNADGRPGGDFVSVFGPEILAGPSVPLFHHRGIATDLRNLDGGSSAPPWWARRILSSTGYARPMFATLGEFRGR